MQLPRKLGLAVCTIAGMSIGGITIAQAGPLTGAAQAAPAITTTSGALLFVCAAVSIRADIKRAQSIAQTPQPRA